MLKAQNNKTYFLTFYYLLTFFHLPRLFRGYYYKNSHALSPGILKIMFLNLCGVKSRKNNTISYFPADLLKFSTKIVIAIQKYHVKLPYLGLLFNFFISPSGYSILN